MTALAENLDGLAEEVAELARSGRHRVAVAESLTGGALSARLAAAPRASEWYRGGVVSYASEVKYALLGVPVGPVVSRQSAEAMAEGVARVLGATMSVALTGVGGPDPQDGEPPGVVWMGVNAAGAVSATRLHFAGGPEEICAQAIAAALHALREALRR